MSEESTWTVGELARATGVTVRTLHHYDQLGLLSPAERSSAGYRLYSRVDLARLYRILALRSLGFELAQIGTLLDADGAELLETARLQLRRVGDQLDQLLSLRASLSRIVAALERAEQPTVEELLQTMEMMSMSISLTRIYTRGGDGGETHLGDLTRVAKTHPRIEAAGAVDELNCWLGVALAGDGLDEPYRQWLDQVQNDLFDVGADLAVPTDGKAERKRLRITSDYVTWLEEACDQANAGLEPLGSFVLPGGGPTAVWLHVCRAVCRRAERTALAVEPINGELVRYLNRLSDLLFILARCSATGQPSLWRPGERTA